MSSAGQRRLTLTLYRSILRWSQRAEDVPFQLRYTDVQRCAPEVFERLDTHQKVWQDARAVRDIAREAFRLNKDLQVSSPRSTRTFVPHETVFALSHSLAPAHIAAGLLTQLGLSSRTRSSRRRSTRGWKRCSYCTRSTRSRWHACAAHGRSGLTGAGCTFRWAKCSCTGSTATKARMPHSCWPSHPSAVVRVVHLWECWPHGDNHALPCAPLTHGDYHSGYWQAWWWAGTRSASGRQGGRPQSMSTPASPSTMCCPMRVSCPASSMRTEQCISHLGASVNPNSSSWRGCFFVACPGSISAGELE